MPALYLTESRPHYYVQLLDADGTTMGSVVITATTAVRDDTIHAVCSGLIGLTNEPPEESVPTGPCVSVSVQRYGEAVTEIPAPEPAA